MEQPQKPSPNKFISLFYKIKDFVIIHKNLIIISLFTCVITLIIAITSYSLYLNSQQQLISPVPNTTIGQGNFPINPTVAANLKDIKSLGILLLGRGGAGHDGGFLTDAIQFLYFDFNNKKVSLISIPRDIQVKLPNGQQDKINAVFNSNPDYAKSAVSEITGLPVNYYVVIDFVGFMRTVGIELNGIEVTVSEVLDDPFYPVAGEENNTCNFSNEKIAQLHKKYSGFDLEKQFICRYEHIHFEPGISQMNGGTALKYARSRHGSGAGDVSRGKRQQEVLIGMKNKILSLQTINNIPALYESLVKNIQTDINLDIAQYLSPLFLSSKDSKLTTINLGPGNVLSASTVNNGGAVFIPKEGIGKWEKTRLFITNQIYSD